MTVWAVIGAGRFASDRMVPAILSTAGASLAGVWARNTTAARTLADRFDAVTYPTAEALAEDPRIDIIYVAATATANADLVRPLLRAGIPVLSEKPLAATATRARELADVSESTGAPCFVNHHLRANSCVTELRARLQDGDLGAITQIEVVNHQILPEPGGWRVHDEDSGGVVRDLTIHDLDLLHHLIGPLTLQDAVVLDDTAVETRVSVALRTADGAPVVLSDEWVSGADAISTSHLIVRGSKGTARIEPAITAAGSVLTIDTPAASTTIPQHGDAYADVAALASRGIRGGTVPLATARTAAVTLETVERILHTIHPHRNNPR